MRVQHACRSGERVPCPLDLLSNTRTIESRGQEQRAEGNCSTVLTQSLIASWLRALDLENIQGHECRPRSYP
jgi:hypothetical protein